MSIGIYKITSPSGKIYIGQSTNIENRWEKGHKYCSGSGKKLQNSIKKYGWDNHKQEIIEECSIEILLERESYWIEYYNSYKKGLNSSLKGGIQGYKDELWKKAHSDGLKGRKGFWEGKKRPKHSDFLKTQGSGLSYERTQEHKVNISKTSKKTWENKKEEIIKKIKQNKIGKKTKSIICNETQKIYSSIKECSEQTNISKGCICSFVKGNYPYPTLRGFTFSYFKKDFIK